MVDPTDKGAKLIRDQSTGTEGYLEYAKQEDEGKVNHLMWGTKCKHCDFYHLWYTFLLSVLVPSSNILLSSFGIVAYPLPHFLFLKLSYHYCVGLFCSPHQVGLPSSMSEFSHSIQQNACWSHCQFWDCAGFRRSMIKKLSEDHPWIFLKPLTRKFLPVVIWVGLVAWWDLVSSTMSQTNQINWINKYFQMFVK